MFSISSAAFADLHARAVELVPCILYQRGYAPAVEGDGGMAAALILEIVRLGKRLAA